MFVASFIGEPPMNILKAKISTTEEKLKFEILNDDETVHESGTDGHPSLKCHRVIADSLIQKMTDINEKQDNLNNE